LLLTHLADTTPSPEEKFVDDQGHWHRDEMVDEQTEKIAQEAIDEGRVVLPGIQALFGFQLIAVFNERFRQLSEGEQLIHFTAIMLVAIAIALIMTPAAYHRLAEQATVSIFFVRLASWLIAAAMVPLMIGLTLEVYLLGRLILGSVRTSLAAAAFLFAIFSTLWFVFPLFMRRFHSQD
jgi:uncharacterized membrane protein